MSLLVPAHPGSPRQRAINGCSSSSSSSCKLYHPHREPPLIAVVGYVRSMFFVIVVV